MHIIEWVGDNMWSADDYLQDLYETTSEVHHHTYDDQWKETVKSRFHKSLGGFEHRDESLDPMILEQTDMGSYQRLRVEISTIDSLKMPVYVLIPKMKQTKKVPAVLAIHGHGYGSKELVGLNPDGSKRSDQGYHKNFAVELVQKGVVVIAPELIGFGDRKLQANQGIGSPNENSCYMIASQLLLLGKTLAGLRVEECRRVINYIQTLPEVDENRIGCMGISGGGLVAGFTSILDDRIRATVISGYTNTFKASIMARRHCLDNHIPGILVYSEMPDLIGLIAPRPLFIEAGTEDHLFPIKDVVYAIDRLKKIYKNFNAKDLLSSHIFEGGHEISGEQSYDWLVNQISL